MTTLVSSHIMVGCSSDEEAGTANVYDDTSDKPMAAAIELRRELSVLHDRSFAWAKTCTGYDEEQAADLLQTCYLKVLDGRASFGGRSSLTTWFFGVIRMTAASERRRRAVRRFLLMESAERRVTPSAESPHDAATASEEREAIVGALRSLSSRQREVIELVFYHDLSLTEAAKVMRVSIGTARTHYHRGKRELALLLADLGGRRI